MSLRSRLLTMCQGLFTRDEDLTVKYEDKDLIYVLKESSTDNMPRTVHQRQRLDCQVRGQGLDICSYVLRGGRLTTWLDVDMEVRFCNCLYKCTASFEMSLILR